MDNDLKRLLEALHQMSQNESWDESRAQELVVWGAELYQKYLSHNSEEDKTIKTND